MASACVNNIGAPTYPSYGWLSPRISFSRDFPDEESSAKTSSKAEQKSHERHDPEAYGKDVGDFEFRAFRLEDPVTMLPADELFSDGKLVPLQITTVRPSVASTAATSTSEEDIRSPEGVKLRRRSEVCRTDPYLFSPKAPRCSSRWRELLGLKKLQSNLVKQDLQKSASSLSSSKNTNSKSFKHFLHKNLKSSPPGADSLLSLPLLRDSDPESISISSRHSLSSSSSSGPDHEDLPRLSLDSDKTTNTIQPISLSKNPPRLRVAKSVAARSVTTAASENIRPFAAEHPTARVGRSPIRRAPDSTSVPSRGVSVDSPRMNSSGKIVFQSLERSTSSPSSFNGGPRIKNRGMERSYSANVRVTPVLNVPVCSLRGSSKSGSVFGFGQFFSSPQKKDGSFSKRPHQQKSH